MTSRTLEAWRHALAAWQHARLAPLELVDDLVEDLAEAQEQVAYWRELALACEANHFETE